MSIIANITPIDFTPKNLDDFSTLRAYAKRAVHHNLMNNQDKAAFNGDLMYHQMFDIFKKPNERKIYQDLGKAWKKDADEIHIYIDFGINHEMLDYIKDLHHYNPNIPLFITSITNNEKTKVTLNEIESFVKKRDGALKISASILSTYNLDYEFTPTTHYSEKEVETIDRDFSYYKRIIMESPFAGAVKDNVRYAKESLFHLSLKGFAPSASHLMYTQMLDDTKQKDRDLGINKGLDIAHDIDTIIMVDRGYSGGMKYGYKRAMDEGREVLFHTISDDIEIQKSVRSLSNWDDFVDFSEDKKKINSELHNKTGYIIDTPDAQKMIKELSENPSKLRGLDLS